VQYCGYQIGRVTRVAPPMPYRSADGRFLHQVMVDMAISRDYSNIPANVRVELIKRGLGSSYIELSDSPMSPEEFDKLEPKFLTENMELQGQTGTANEFFPEGVWEQIETMVEGMTVLLENLNIVLGDKDNRTNFKQSLENLAKATDRAAVALEEFRRLSVTGTDTIKRMDAKITDVSDSVIASSEELGETLIELRRILHKISSGEGTIGRLVNDDRLYENLLDSTEELQLSLEKIKETFDKTSKKGIQVGIF